MQNKKGYSLVITLWIVLIFTALITTYFYQSYVNSKLVKRNFRRIEARNLALIGLGHAITDLKNDLIWENYKGETEYEGMKGPRSYDAKCDIWYSEPTYNQKNYPFEDDEDSFFVVKVIPLNTKLNINKVSPEILDTYFKELGFDDEKAQELANEIIDWRDRDDTVVDKEEKEIIYYNDENTENPKYIPFNRNYKIIEELLQVKDITPKLFFNVKEENLEEKRKILFKPYNYYFLSDEDLENQKNSLLDVFTIYNFDNKININFASKFMLKLILKSITKSEDAAVSMAQKIIDYRNDENQTDFENVVPYRTVRDIDFSGANLPPEAYRYFTVKSSYFKIIAIGFRKKTKYTIIAYVKRTWEKMTLVDNWEDKWNNIIGEKYYPIVRIVNWMEK